MAWLRRIGMPLARIRTVCGLPPAAADRGLVRESNQDRAHAGPRLLAVAVGFGPAGDAADAAIDALRRPEDDTHGSVLGALQDAVRRAGDAVRDLVSSDPAVEGGGTTLTAVPWSGSRLALVHVGDSRCYLLRDGGLFQITHDHTVVQSLVDEGRLTGDEAASHPERAILVRALHGGPEVEVREVRAGDRYLLCSDGLHSVVPAARLRSVLVDEADPDAAVRVLVGLAIEGGGPDNVTCVVADVVPA